MPGCAAESIGASQKQQTEKGFDVLEITVRGYRKVPSAPKSFVCKDKVL